MKAIGILIDQIDEEIENAKNYTESYLEYKANKKDSINEEISAKYKVMAEDEIKHANFLNDIATMKVEELYRDYTPPVNMLDIWNRSNQRYVEKVAWLKQMLSM